LKFFVKNVNGTIEYNVTNKSYPQSLNIGYVATNTPGATLQWGFNASHATYGHLGQINAITFHSYLWDLGLSDVRYYTWISVAFLLLLTSLFSVVTSKFGYILVPMFAMFFNFLGWLSVNYAVIASCLVLGVLLYMTKREKEGGL